MSKSNTFENELLLLIFNNVDISDIGDATGLRGSSLAGSLYFAAHTADPGEGGTQATSEATYGSYTRQGLARTAGNFSVTGNAVALVANLDFPEASSGAETLTHFSVGVASSGASKILYKGTLTPNIQAVSGVIPRFKAGTMITED